MYVNCNKNAMLCAIAKPHPIKILVTVCRGKVISRTKNKKRKTSRVVYYLIKKDHVIFFRRIVLFPSKKLFLHINAIENLKTGASSSPPPPKHGQCSQMVLFKLELCTLCTFLHFNLPREK